MKKLPLLWLLFLSPVVFAAIPIQEKNLIGITAAEARLKLIAKAESFVGTPYRYAGADRRGLDCSGFVFLSFKEGLNFTIPRSSEGIYNWAEKIETRDLQPGDLVFFVTVGRNVSHLGIYIGDGKFIHSASEGTKTGVIYSRLDESYWNRTYKGAGRALPWDANAARPEASPNQRQIAGSATPDLNPDGFFTGFGAAWTWGTFFEGAPSLFRGVSGLAVLGYKWSEYQACLELRFEWDNALGVFRLPFTLALGSDNFRFFGGPAYTFGDPALKVKNGRRLYSGGGEWLWELGAFFAFPPVMIDRRAVSLYGELAWQPYHWQEGTDFSFAPDVTANIRFSTGIRYLYKL